MYAGRHTDKHNTLVVVVGEWRGGGTAVFSHLKEGQVGREGLGGGD